MSGWCPVMGHQGSREGPGEVISAAATLVITSNRIKPEVPMGFRMGGVPETARDTAGAVADSSL